MYMRSADGSSATLSPRSTTDSLSPRPRAAALATIIMASSALLSGNLPPTRSQRAAEPAQQSISMADDVVRVCPGHPRASPTSQTCLADLLRVSSTVTVEVTRSSIRAAEGSRWSCDDTERRP